MKKLAFAFALVAMPAMAFAQNSGVVVRDPAGGATPDPALGVGTMEPSLKRDPAGGVMVDDSPRFRAYVVEQSVPSYVFAEPMAVGAVLPQEGVVYREVPAEFGPRGYSFTIVNGRTVLVEPGTRRIVQIIN